ncbi:MAG: sn-glycerol-3-phosphate ABC transporter ATP-binding protein UgpC [Hyphomicrobiales bacterium]|nr:sn-glycerol-3-phosphate ABC transporter ATP-binding protein UgpC [Hyphomicrobiales bacterium]
MASVGIKEVRKAYGSTEVIHGINVEILDGEFVTLVGPSGCGKSTLLRMIAGLEEITSGEIRIGERVVNDVPPKERDIAMVFQNYALYPHMTVAQHIGFGLKLRGLGKQNVASKVREAADLLGLTEWLERRPSQLSGGQRQRVAMGRAIVREPSVFLMDEPLSNLDAKLRVQMRSEVSRIARQVGVATLYVTHDQVEAMTMGDRVAVLRLGVLQQVAPPQDIYDRPVNLFVAAFIGSPAMNLYEAEVGPGATSLRLGSQTLELSEAVTAMRPGLLSYSGRQVVAGLRPEHLSAADGRDGPQLAGDVDLVEALGSELLVHFRIDAKRAQSEAAQADEDVALAASGEGVARADPRTPVQAGARLRFTVDTERLHFFDKDSGDAIWN